VGTQEFSFEVIQVLGVNEAQLGVVGVTIQACETVGYYHRLLRLRVVVPQIDWPAAIGWCSGNVK